MDVTGSTKAFGSGEVIANTLRERIKYELGLTISVGVSFCKVFAKLGSDMKKPDAVTVIPKDNFRDIIWDLPASDMLGVGRSTEKFLSSYGIHTIGQLANAYPDLMQRKLGKNGMVLLAFANGEDRSKVAPQDYEPPMKSIGHGITTMQDLENNAEVWNIMLALTQDIGHKLRVYNKNAAGVAIYIRYIVDKQIAGKQCKLSSPTKMTVSPLMSLGFSLPSLTICCFCWRIRSSRTEAGSSLGSCGTNLPRIAKSRTFSLNAAVSITGRSLPGVLSVLRPHPQWKKPCFAYRSAAQ